MFKFFNKRKAAKVLSSSEALKFRSGRNLLECEFFKTPKGHWMMEDQDGNIITITQRDTDVINFVIEYFGEYYPDALKDAQKEAKRCLPNKPYYNYRVAWLLIMCNLSEYDGNKDINSKGIIRLEYVNCPLRGWCKSEGVRCNPRFNSKLSRQQLMVMRMLYQRQSIQEIADTLCLSPRTVENHRRYALGKLKLHSTSDFIAWAANHKMFD